MRNDNLIPNEKRTPSELREITSKGGKASGQARRRNKSMREVFRQIKNLPVNDTKLKQQLEAVGVDDKDITYAAAMAWSTMYHAIKGNSQMMRLAFEMMGEDPAIDIKKSELALKKKEFDLRKRLADEGKAIDGGDDVVIMLPEKLAAEGSMEE